MPAPRPGPGPRFYTPDEVAVKFRVNVKTIQKWANSGKLRTIRTPGRHRRYFADQVDAMLGPAAVPGPAEPAPVEHISGRSEPRPAGPPVECDVRVWADGLRYQVVCLPHAWSWRPENGKRFTFLARIVAEHATAMGGA